LIAYQETDDNLIEEKKTIFSNNKIKNHSTDQLASSVANSTPRCNIGLKRYVNGKGTLAKTNIENNYFLR
jgi:hypothetical protein